MFDYDYGDFYAGEYTKTGDLIDVQFGKEYFSAYGYCMKMIQTKFYLYISSTKDSIFFLVDPETQNRRSKFEIK